MSRNLVVAAAQLGPVSRDESRSSAVARMCELMTEAAAGGASLVVFPELALTTFFPRWFMEDQADVENAIKKCIDDGVDAVWPGCDIWPDVKKDNMETYIRTVKEYGKK